MIRVSVFARCRSGRRWWRAWLLITICVTAGRSVRRRNGRSRRLRNERSQALDISDAKLRIESAIEAFARGEIVVVSDDDDRENEGDLFVAASLCTADKMAFIIRHTSGIVCA